MNIIRKGLLYQSSTYKKCNVVEQKKCITVYENVLKCFPLLYNEKFNVSVMGYYFNNQETKVFLQSINFNNGS